jgi:hypothetical protein
MVGGGGTGTICIENATMIFLMIVVAFLLYFIYNSHQSREHNHKNNNVYVESTSTQNNHLPFQLYNIGNRGNDGGTGDVLLDPYTPPLKNEGYFTYPPRRGMPINISTNIGAIDTSYRQVGLLTPLHDSSSEKILPLMGRPLNTSRYMWQYYTMTDKTNSVKLPIIKNKKSCTNEYGCDELYERDVVFVKGYNKPFKVTIYDNDSVRYIPQL